MTSRPRILVHNYGHAREPGDAAPLNSVLLTNHHAVEGCRQVGDVVDLSPVVGPDGIRWDLVGAGALAAMPPDGAFDLLYCQASVSLEVIRWFRAHHPGKPVVLQRDSTHAAHHAHVMRAELDRLGYPRTAWKHPYERDGAALLKRECAEYELADRILVLSRHVEGTFRARGFGSYDDAGRLAYFGPQLAEVDLWPTHPWDARLPLFTAIAVGSLGARKGTLRLLEAWAGLRERLGPRAAHAHLVVCGLPDAQDPPELQARVAAELRRAAARGVEWVGWQDMRSMPARYRQAHAWVSLALEEGSTMPWVEAALSGCLLAATPAAGVDAPHFALDPDPARAADALHKLFWYVVDQGPAAAARAAEGAERARRECAPAAYAGRVAAVLRGVLGGDR